MSDIKYYLLAILLTSAMIFESLIDADTIAQFFSVEEA